MTDFITTQMYKRNVETKYSKPNIRYKVIDRIEFRINTVMNTTYKQYLLIFKPGLSYLWNIK